MLTVAPSKLQYVKFTFTASMGNCGKKVHPFTTNNLQFLSLIKNSEHMTPPSNLPSIQMNYIYHKLQVKWAYLSVLNVSAEAWLAVWCPCAGCAWWPQLSRARPSTGWREQPSAASPHTSPWLGNGEWFICSYCSYWSQFNIFTHLGCTV